MNWIRAKPTTGVLNSGTTAVSSRIQLSIFPLRSNTNINNNELTHAIMLPLGSSSKAAAYAVYFSYWILVINMINFR